MRRKIRMMKKLFLRIAMSCTINWILWFIVIIGMALNIWNISFYKCLTIFLFVEVMLLDINVIER